LNIRGKLKIHNKSRIRFIKYLVKMKCKEFDVTYELCIYKINYAFDIIKNHYLDDLISPNNDLL
jgi:hypothetical protein